MIEKEEEVKRKNKPSMRWVCFLPIIILLGIVPLVVRLVMSEVVDAEMLYLTNTNADFFTQGKAVLIMVCAGLMVLAAFLAYDKKYIKIDGVSKIYYSAFAVLGIMTVLSAVLSEHGHIAKWGMSNRGEGMWVLLSYFLITLYTFNVVQKQSDYKYMLYPLGFLVSIMTILGIFQYIGKDLLFTEWAGKLIIAEEYLAEGMKMKAMHGPKHVYGTIEHYNYMGSFGAMLAPLFITLACFIKDKKIKILAVLMSLCSVFLLLASTSRAGIIGIVSSVIIGGIIFSRYFLKRWKLLIGILLLGIVGILGLDQVSNGAIFARIPSLIKDMTAIVKPVDDAFDYRETLPIKDITHEAGKATLHLENEKLVISTEDGKLHFTDAAGQEVVYVYVNMGVGNVYYFTDDPRFASYKFDISDNGKKEYAMLRYNNVYVASFSTQEEVHLLEHFTKEPMEIQEPAAIGFKGKEKLGSARGYIWSRSLPLIKDTWLVGYGPDNYGFYFPQTDIMGKWYAYGDPNMTVDKPHNLYLQIAINEGVIALLAFLVLVGVYLIQSFKLYGVRKQYEEKHIVGIAFMLGIVGYLGAGFFNDSVVSVAPIFWVMLGVGMALNYTANKNDIKEEKNKAHATISIKSKRHVR